ncbi:Ig-like domain-containing protein [Solirubrobacter ginsenosidimutans]|uniref:Ig-like domain-containing protein n=1 Tax=Solirubrobacter ginsenosidimutans TaxID=490573 RepID=A0A9X3MZJ7_9ACTN|nr:Ig-like domain-containing protein [Solirubrobacter ginsenosidimutans]MDA0164531.1 Ig-like domain-containing protein [Solirubrobacter ginsenosidimutans]
MRRSFRALACAACLFAAWFVPASAQAANGQLAAVVDGRLMAFNADGSGLRMLPVPDAGQITELAFSPGGNRLAFVKAGGIGVLELTTGRILGVTAGATDANPAWASDGGAIAFRRGVLTYRVAPTPGAALDPFLVDLLAGTTDIAWAPGLAAFAPVVAGLLVLPGVSLDLPPAVRGVPAWAPDNSAVAFARDGGLSSIPTAGGAVKPLVEGPAAAPRWSPDATALVYAAGAEVRIAAATGGTPRTVVTGAERVGPVDWQPCVAVTASCESVAAPRCSATSATATTQSDQPVDLPPPPCTDPAGRRLDLVVAKEPEHGTLTDLHYTPAAGYSGQDTVAYRVSNGVVESETYRVTIFVVPRPVAPAPLVGVRPPVLVQGAPFLSARATPRLDRKRTALVKLACDQDCSLAVHLTAKLRSKRMFTGPQVKRSLVASRVLTLRLRLPSKPRGKIKTVWVVGRVRNAAGDVRNVRLPVSLPR